MRLDVYKKYVVTDNTSGHAFPLGSIVEFKGYDEDGDSMFQYPDGSDWWWVKKCDVEETK